MGTSSAMNVLLDTSPLRNANSIRGVGVYTRFLEQELKKLDSDSFHLFSSEVDDRIKHVDLVHYPFFDLFFRTLPRGKMNQKVVVTIHDVIPLLFPEYYPVGVRGKVNFWMQKQSLKRVDAILTDSESSKRDIHHFLNIPLNKIHVIYLAGNPEISKVAIPIQDEIRKKYHLPSKYILYVGDINYNKNVPSLIESLTLVNESVHLVCVGKNFRDQPIPEWSRISSAIQKFKLTNRVNCISELSTEANRELSALYSGAELYVQPSLYEGFGLPVLEALQCGTPVLAGKNSSLLEIGGDVVEYADTSPQNLADGIQKILGRNKKNNAKWQESVSKHLEMFSWEKTAINTVRVYQSLFPLKH